MRAFLKLAASIALLLAAPACAQWRGRTGGSPVPAPARSAGFLTRTFDSPGFSAANVDLANAKASGKQWYLWGVFGCQATASEVVMAADGAASIYGHCGPNGTVMSAMSTSASPGYVGTAFGGGGYFEAEVAFDPTTVDTRKGWPSWWTMAAEHLFYLPGLYQPGQDQYFEHFIEADIFEALRDHNAAPRTYASTLHDWYGKYNVTCGGFCVVDTPYNSNTSTAIAGTDWTLFHRVAMLWVPATDTMPGSIRFFFDDLPIGQTVTWSKYTAQAPPYSLDSPWAFGVTDVNHLVLILGAGPDSPIRVRRVSVWQASAANNLVN